MAAKHAIAARRGEQRRGERQTLLLRAAKLVTGAGEFLCLVRDVSDRGLKAKLFHPLDLDGPCEIELGNGERIALECVWRRDDLAGFRFPAGSIEIPRLIEESGPFPKRHLRLKLEPPLPLLTRSEGQSEAGLLLDISQHGGAVALERCLPLHALVCVDAPELPPLNALVRWRRGGTHGLVFQQGFRLDNLAQLAWLLQLRSEGGGGAVKRVATLTTD